MATQNSRACSRNLMPTLLAVNFVVYIIILGLASWSVDKLINGEQNHPHLGGNESTSFMLMFGLIGGVVGACSVIAGLFHHFAWTYHSLAASAPLAIISWAFSALAFGLVCKEIILGGHRGKRLQTLEAFITISAVSQLLYVMLLHAGMFNSRYGPAGYCDSSNNLGDDHGGVVCNISMTDHGTRKCGNIIGDDRGGVVCNITMTVDETRICSSNTTFSSR